MKNYKEKIGFLILHKNMDIEDLRKRMEIEDNKPRIKKFSHPLADYKWYVGRIRAKQKRLYRLEYLLNSLS